MVVRTSFFENVQREYLKLKWLKDEVTRQGLFEGKETKYWIYAISIDYVTEKGPAMLVIARTEDSTVIHVPEYLNSKQANAVLEVFSRGLDNKEKIITLTNRDYNILDNNPYYNKFNIELGAN